MLHRLPDHSAVISTFSEASASLEQDVFLLDSEQALESTVAGQLALLIAGVAIVFAHEIGAHPHIMLFNRLNRV